MHMQYGSHDQKLKKIIVLTDYSQQSTWVTKHKKNWHF